MQVRTAAVPPFFKNGYVVSCEDTREAVVIDPGDEVPELLRMIRDGGLTPRAVLLTHAHLDHITGVGRAKAALGVPVWLHPDDLFLYEGIVEQGQMFGLAVDPQPPVDRFYGRDGDIRFGRYDVKPLHTPGHCPGGVCLAIGRSGGIPELFVGNTLFAGPIGRTDLPGGDLDVLLTSIRKVLFTFADNTVVHSGHGPDTTIGAERRSNPFLV